MTRSISASVLLGMLLACGSEEEAPPPPTTSAAAPNSAATPASPTPAPAPAFDPTVPRLGIAAEGLECVLPRGNGRMLRQKPCIIRPDGDELMLAGPIGAVFRIGEANVTLGETDRRAEDPRAPSYLRGKAAMKTISFPREALLSGSLQGICVEAPTGLTKSLSVSVTLPDVPTPMTKDWEFGGDDIRRILNEHLSAARRGEVELPALSGNATVAGGGCIGGHVDSLDDIRYVVESDERTRSVRCRYRTSGGGSERRSITHVDERLELYDIRSGDRVARTTLRAPTRDCASSIRRGREHMALQTSRVPGLQIRTWVRESLSE